MDPVFTQHYDVVHLTTRNTMASIDKQKCCFVCCILLQLKIMFDLKKKLEFEKNMQQSTNKNKLSTKLT